MNYLEEIKRLKKEEEEKKAKLARIKADKEKNKKQYLSDLTFMNFEKYILERIPFFIEQGIKRKPFDNKVEISFHIGMGIFDDCLKNSDHDNIGIEIGREEFVKYIRSIPGHIASTLGGGTYRETFELDTLAKFYYEKMQELEYYNIDYSENKSR